MYAYIFTCVSSQGINHSIIVMCCFESVPHKIINSKNLIECLSIKFTGSNFIESYIFNNSLLK